MTPKISVIIPVYNLEGYIKEGIESILNQTLKDIEIIAVNDGSSDNSLNILENYIDKDERVSVINLLQNRGQSAARNEGLKKASGEYVYFFDGDDILKKEALYIAYNKAEDNNLDVVNFDAETFHHDNYLKFNPNYNRGGKIPNKIFTGKDYIDFLVDNKLLTVSIPLNLIRRKLLIENNLKFIEGIIHEDHVFITELYIEAKRIEHLEKILYRRRIRPKSTMTTKKSKYNLISYIRVINELKKIYFDKYKSISVRRQINSVFGSILLTSYEIGLYNQYKDKIHEIFQELNDVLSFKTKIKYRFLSSYYIYIKARKFIDYIKIKYLKL